MRRSSLAAVLAVSISVIALAAGPAAARPAAPSTLTLTASVANQQCQGGDFVNVTLTATADSSSQVLGYKWDFTNDGRLDTRVLSDPTITHRYPDEINVTARVVAKNAEGNTASDTVSFATMRCG
jgi:PKD domain